MDKNKFASPPLEADFCSVRRFTVYEVRVPARCRIQACRICHLLGHHPVYDALSRGARVGPAISRYALLV